jgi:hypothetical protein
MDKGDYIQVCRILRAGKVPLSHPAVTYLALQMENVRKPLLARIKDLESQLAGRELLALDAWAKGTARIQHLEGEIRRAKLLEATAETPVFEVPLGHPQRAEDWLDGPMQDERHPRILEAPEVALLKREFGDLLGLGEWQETRQDVLNLIATLEAAWKIV